MSTEVEFDCLYLGQVAVLWVLVYVAVCPATKQGRVIRTLVATYNNVQHSHNRYQLRFSMIKEHGYGQEPDRTHCH